jgi:hypothetical protein
MTPFHWWLLAAGFQLLFSIGLVGSIAAGFYWRFKYEGISERMHNAIQLIDAGQIEDAREILSEH